MSNNVIPEVIMICGFLYVFFVHKPLCEKFGFIKVSLFLAAMMMMIVGVGLFIITFKDVGFGIIVYCLPFLYGAYLLFKISITFPKNKDLFTISRRD